jgi:arabinose-5-phosphate isomerase
MDASIAIARRVIDTEAEGLSLLSAQLDQAFSSAVKLILSLEGRVIVSGMGKSGHIGRKIAATLASTGTPAQFVHPAEASHGDLGMLTVKDAALMLSNSGETSELLSMIEHTRRFGIPLIGVASRLKSTLLSRSDIALVLPQAPEACAIRLAPTTSTTMTLALGDALAVALMVAKGFTAQDFRTFHPGGALGAQLVLVKDLMHSGEELPLITQSATISDAILEMTAKSFGVTGVVDENGELTGIVTDGDLRRGLKLGSLADISEQKADAIVTKKPKTIAPSLLGVEALAVMNRFGISSLFVLDQNKPVGLLHIHDCLRAGLC